MLPAAGSMMLPEAEMTPPEHVVLDPSQRSAPSVEFVPTGSCATARTPLLTSDAAIDLPVRVWVPFRVTRLDAAMPLSFSTLPAVLFHEAMLLTTLLPGPATPPEPLAAIVNDPPDGVIVMPLPATSGEAVAIAEPPVALPMTLPLAIGAAGVLMTPPVQRIEVPSHLTPPNAATVARGRRGGDISPVSCPASIDFPVTVAVFVFVSTAAAARPLSSPSVPVVPLKPTR